ncbi:MAG: T9SS type A sorting domain-containing protein [Bacteroidota bacterium]
MRKISSACIAILIAASAGAQTYLNKQPNIVNRPQDKKVNFWDLQRAFEDYWADKDVSDTEGGNAEEGGYQQFKRWEWFFKQRTYPSGEFPSSDILFTEYQKYKEQYAAGKSMFTQAANWSFIGPGVVPGNGGGAGRINCITFHPTNTNIIYVGAACGGLWKSTDGGLTWTCNTDLLPSLSISDIVINPANPQEIYLATGDKFGIYVQYETWGHYSAGVLKSTDGGATWNATGFSNVLANNVIIQRLVMDPANTNTLYAATFSGIYKTTNGGTTWTNIRNGYFYDLELAPGTPSTIYAGDNMGFQISTNSGSTWNYVSGVTSTGRTSIAVTPINGTVVYVWTEGGNFYYSGNSGTSFTVRTNPSGSCTPYGHYDMVLEVSPVNANVLFAGGLEVAKSTNGGTSWATVSDWSSWPASNYVHADQKNILFLPGSNNMVFAVNDGGIFKSTDQGVTWTDLSNGIDIKQYYRHSSSYQNPNIIFAGSQDNGTDKITGINTATQVMGADGEECLVDFTNDQIVFVSTQGGYFYRSINGGGTFTSVSPTGCDWTSPLTMDPNNNNIIYLGDDDVYKSTNNGVTFTSVSPSLDGTCIYSIEVAPSNSNYVYAATFGSIWRTTTGNAPWTNVTGTLPVGSAAITGIAVSGSNPNMVWVTFSGFSAGNKVYFTSNGGATWTNISGTLQNIPVNCIEYQNGSNDLVYIGTDLGVYYMDGSMNDWAPYNTGLPNVIIDDLEVYYPTSKLRAATYGRGIWESDLQVSTLQNLDASAFSVSYPPSQTCSTSIAPIVVIRNSGVSTLTSVDLYYSMDGQPYQLFNWTGSLVSFATANVTLPVYNLTSGTHTLVAYTSNPNSSLDQNTQNDTVTYSFDIIANPVGSAPPLQEGFVSTSFPPANWLLENSSNLWSRSSTVGGYSQSSNSARANFYSISTGDDRIITPYIDFTNVIPPIKLYFDVAYAPYSSGYLDSLFVEVYTDCNPAGSRLYTKGYLSLATAPATTSQFVPAANQWRTDTIGLDSLAGDPAKRFRFIAKSGYGNHLYIDNINLTGGLTDVNLLQGGLEIAIFPNPAGDAIYVQTSAESEEQTRVIIYDLTGNILQSSEVYMSASSQLKIDVSAFSQGVYFVKAEAGGVVKTQKISVIR